MASIQHPWSNIYNPHWFENFIRVGIWQSHDQGDHGLISNSDDHELGNHCSDYCTGSRGVTQSYLFRVQVQVCKQPRLWTAPLFTLPPSCISTSPPGLINLTSHRVREISHYLHLNLPLGVTNEVREAIKNLPPFVWRKVCLFLVCRHCPTYWDSELLLLR